MTTLADLLTQPKIAASKYLDKWDKERYLGMLAREVDNDLGIRMDGHIRDDNEAYQQAIDSIGVDVILSGRNQYEDGKKTRVMRFSLDDHPFAIMSVSDPDHDEDDEHRVLLAITDPALQTLALNRIREGFRNTNMDADPSTSATPMFYHGGYCNVDLETGVINFMRRQSMIVVYDLDRSASTKDALSLYWFEQDGYCVFKHGTANANLSSEDALAAFEAALKPVCTGDKRFMVSCEMPGCPDYEKSPMMQGGYALEFAMRAARDAVAAVERDYIPSAGLAVTR